MYFSGKSLIKEMPWCCRNPVCVVQFSCIHGEGAVVTCDVMTHSMHKTAQRQEVSISRGLAEACQRHHGQRHDFFSEKGGFIGPCTIDFHKEKINLLLN